MKRALTTMFLSVVMVLIMLPSTAWAANTSTHVFYDQLSADQKAIYDVLNTAESIQKMRDGDEITMEVVKYCASRDDLNTASSANSDNIAAALVVFQWEHPELFWVRGWSYSTSISYSGIPGNVTFTLNMELPVAANWQTGGRSISGDEKTLNDAVTAIVNTASQKGSDYQKLLYIHDWLTTHNVYNMAAVQSDSWDDQLPWTPLSALSNVSQPVCEGYARAFKVLCDRLNIPCLLVTGTGNGGGHMWNYVQLNGSWYAVDVTWDDPVVSGVTGEVSGFEGHAYFLAGSTKMSRTHSPDLPNAANTEMKWPTLSSADYDPNAVQPGWHQDSNGWWYQNADGSYPRNCWKSIDGIWYYFTDSGYVKTGWLQDGGNWYYFSKDGYMKTGWVKVDGNWYYFNPSGAMRTGWLQDGGSWYYFSKDGYMKTGWVKVDGTWYYFNSNGAMHTGWLQDGGTWYYFDKNGYMKTGWVKVDDNWYYFNANGTIHTGWLQDGANRYYCTKDGYLKTGWLLYEGHWYYFSQGGYMKTGWIYDNGNWYYMNSDGTMATDQWIGDYYVKSNGVMATDEWIGDYYVDENGRWVPGKVKEN